MTWSLDLAVCLLQADERTVKLKKEVIRAVVIVIRASFCQAKTCACVCAVPVHTDHVLRLGLLDGSYWMRRGVHWCPCPCPCVFMVMAEKRKSCNRERERGR